MRDAEGEVQSVNRSETLNEAEETRRALLGAFQAADGFTVGKVLKSKEFAAQRDMKRFLRGHLYQHYQVLRMASKAQRIVSDLFAAFTADPRLLPPQYQVAAGGEQVRRVADYIAGLR